MITVWDAKLTSDRITVSSFGASPYMDLETSGRVCVPDRFGVLPAPAGIRFLLSVLSASPLDMCLFSGSCGETGKAGVGGG